jgi:hypothetical protein
MLFERDKHPEDVLDEMRPALGDAVDENWRSQLRRLEACNLSVERVRLELDMGHRSAALDAGKPQ